MSTDITRRGFLKGLSVAAGSFFISRDIFAQGAVPANDKINVGVIGLGKMAHGHIGGLATSPQCRITAICDVDDQRLAYQKKRIEDVYARASGGKPSDSVKTYKDFRELLADKSIDAVFVVTPDHWHAIISILAARAGKAVYCEKPLTFTVAEGDAVIKAVRENGVVFQTGSQQRSESSFRWYAQVIRSGLLGEIKEMYCDFGRKYPLMLNFEEEPLPKGMDWDMWLGPAPYRPYTKHFLYPLMMTPDEKGSDPYRYPWGEWRWHAEYGSGLQADWGAHHIDITQWALGLDGKGPKYVEVFESINPADKNDKFDIRYIYENGIRLNYGYPKQLVAPSDKQMVMAVGKNGVIGASRGGKRYASDPRLLSAKPVGDGLNVYVSTNHKDDFFNAVRSGAGTICPAEVGVSSCNACLIGNIAHMLGRTLEYDWRTRSFKGDAEANRYLSRPNRGQWANI